MMALKSGLLAESTWALDTLTVLLFDDHTITYFSLQHMPGLVEVLLEHYRHCLTAIFHSFNETTVLECKQPNETLKGGQKQSDQTAEPSECDVSNSSLPEGTTETIDSTTVLSPSKSSDGNDYTYHTRQGKQVKIEMNSDVVNTVADPKHWDHYEYFDDTNVNLWMAGQGCVTDHIVTQFENTDTNSVLFDKFYGTKYSSVRKQLSKEKAKEKEEICTKEVKMELCDLMESIEAQEEPSCDNKCDVKEEPKSPAPSKPSESPKKDDGKENTSDDKVEERMEVDDKTEETKGAITKEKSDKADNKDQDETKQITDQSKNENSKKEETTTDQTKDDTSEISVEMLKYNLPYFADSEQEALTKKDLHVVESLKRAYEEMEGEAESYSQDKLPLDLCSQTEEELSQRCMSISTILRNLSFVPGNEAEMSKQRSLIMILGRLMLLYHEHVKKSDDTLNSEDCLSDNSVIEHRHHEWWWDTLETVRENTLVTLANIAGYLNLQIFPEEVSLPVFDGLLHWAVCQSSYAMDIMPSMSPKSGLTPQRLVLETMCKLCVTKTNVDLLLATPPYSRILHLIGCLVRLLADKKEQVLREFAIVLLASIVEGSSSVARAVALHQPCIALLIDFIESAEQLASQNIHPSMHLPMHQDSSDIMGTTLDMLKRAASALAHISEVPVNKSMFLQHQPRLLKLVMSNILDQSVSSHLADVLFRCSQS